MADATTQTNATPAVPAVTPGSQTSEFWLTKLWTIASLVLSVLFGALTQIHDSGLVPADSKAGQIIAGLLAALMVIAGLTKSVAYTNARTAVKVANAQVVSVTPAARDAAAEANAALEGK